MTVPPSALSTFRSRCRLALLAATACILAPQAAQAETPMRLQVLEDPAGTLSVEDVAAPGRAGAFRDVSGVYAGGYTRKVHWFRITLPAAGDAAPRARLLEIEPAYLDDIRLFRPDPGHPGRFTVSRTGDTWPFRSREVPGRNFVFAVDLPADRELILYARLQTSSSSFFHARLWKPGEFAEAQAGEYALLGLYFGLMTAMLLFNLWHGQWRREATYRSFIAYLLSSILLMLGLSGLVGEYLTPDWPDISDRWVSAFVFISIMLAARFHRSILDIGRGQPLLNAYFLLLVWLPAALTPYALLGHFTETVRVLLMVSMFAPMMGLLRSVTLIREGRIGSRLLLLANLTSLAGYTYTLMGSVGITHGTVLQLYGVQINALIVLLAFNAVLMSRLRHLQQENLRAQKAAELAQSAHLAARLAQQRQGALLGMLTHELKTPLGVIRLALARLDGDPAAQRNARAAVLDINEVVNRCMEADKLDQDAIAVETAPCDLVSLLEGLREKSGEAERIRLDLATSLPTPVSDPLLLRTVVSNLVDNALKYGATGSPVDIRAHAQSHINNHRRGVLLTVANRCGEAGLPDPQQIFERYYRSPGAHARTGSGLGLFVARQMAERLGALIDYHPPRDDDLVRFTLWIPLFVAP